jgi:hypothetical protein
MMSGSNQANEPWSAYLNGKTNQFNFSYENPSTQTIVPASNMSSSNKENTRNKVNGVSNQVSNYRGSKRSLLPPPPSSRLIGGGKRKTRGKGKGKSKSATRKKKKQY